VTEPGRARTHPVAVEGQLEAGLSRGLSLVKWLLAIPHYLVLGVMTDAYPPFRLDQGGLDHASSAPQARESPVT
jgi:hypothetical protein